jgi:FKBP-type peptidyl-prolyl cis-trans isomerase FkpA
MPFHCFPQKAVFLSTNRMINLVIESMTRQIFIALGLTLGLALWSGCADDVADQFATDQQLIANYVTENDLEGEYTEEGVFITFQNEGKGRETPDLTSTVQAIYTGYLLDGTVFDDSDGFPASFRLTGVIQGWQIALPRFKRDAIGTIIIPSRYAYGPQRRQNIPANSVLIFDIEVLDFN